MARTVNEVMTADPRTISPSDTLADAAREMRDGDVGAIVVVEDGRTTDIVTDRDIVVRGLAEGHDAGATVGEILTGQALVTIEMDQQASEAADLMRRHDIRRLVVVQAGRPAGIVSIGDLAVELDTESALADISAASPNN